MKQLILFFLVVYFGLACAGPSVYGLRVQGNKIFNGNGQVMQFRGVDRSGTEFMCIHGDGIFDGPHDINSLSTIKSWNVSIIRIPLNEDCWLAINGADPRYSGYNYQSAIRQFVESINSLNMAAILDLHWTGAGSQQATGQQPMPNRDHSLDFWTSVANTFKNNSAVIFDVFNEPYPDNNQDTTNGWNCWKNGGYCGANVNFNAAGMQDLVNVIRKTGSQNILMLGGLQYSNALSQWLNYMPSDPTGNLVASWHSYNFNLCNNPSCWNSIIAPLIQKVPLIVGEIGENDCSGQYVSPLMNFLDSVQTSYLAWTWNTWDCNGGPALITSYGGNPTNYGSAIKAHFIH